MTEEDKKKTEETKEEKKDVSPAKEEKKSVTPPAEPKKEEAKVEPKKEEKKVEETKDVEIPKKFKSIVEEIEKMSVLDLSELVKILEDKFGVSAAAPMMMGAMPGTGGVDAVVAEEKISFDVELTETGGNKIAVIKAIRSITSLGLKEAKDLTDKNPSIVLEGADKDKADEAKKVMEEAGAKVTLK